MGLSMSPCIFHTRSMMTVSDRSEPAATTRQPLDANSFNINSNSGPLPLTTLYSTIVQSIPIKLIILGLNAKVLNTRILSNSIVYKGSPRVRRDPLQRCRGVYDSSLLRKPSSSVSLSAGYSFVPTIVEW
mgnify:CR=1 FL=1